MKLPVSLMMIAYLFGLAAVGFAQEEKQGAPPLPPAPLMMNDEPDVAHLRTAFSQNVTAPDTIICANIGAVRMVGITPPPAGSPGYQKSLAATRKYALRKSVKLDVCPVQPKDASGAVRARVYYLEGGKWHNLNTKMLRAGLAAANMESPCHVKFDSWPALVRQAREHKRGLFHMGITVPEEATGMVMARPLPDSPMGVMRGGMPGGRDFGALTRDLGLAEPRGNMQFVGSSTAKRYHAFDCLARPMVADAVYFENADAAKQAGFSPCLICKPGK